MEVNTNTKRFNTFEGVFTPSLLSILGVIMYLRLGWVVGSVGLIGAFAIIILSNLITLMTALSMSSIVTNIRIGAGGAYSIITKSLGIEAGGSIGIPLYISQAISSAFYITGFSECWLFVFPTHNLLLVSVIVWAVLLLISYVSTKLAFRVQFLIMVLIGLSIVSIVLGKGTVNEAHSYLFNDISLDNFWKVFAIFFPAVTGILAGASMSGELKDPKTSILKGTLWAIFVGFAVYMFLSFWFAKHAMLSELKTNSFISIELGRWHSLVIAGIMGATISSALAMLVSAPRVLVALANHKVIPFHSSVSYVNKKGEPTTAILVTSFISLLTIAIFQGSLNNIASLLTMFFLITYGTINFSVFVEQAIGIASFRPSFRVWKIVPLLGGIGCVSVMFLINPEFSIFAILVIIITYSLLMKKGINSYSPDVRSGMLVFCAEFFARGASNLPYYPKIWKPNLLVFIKNNNDFSHIIPFINSIIYPSGRLIVFKTIDAFEAKKADIIGKDDKDTKKETLIDTASKELDVIVQPLRDKNIFVETTAVEANDKRVGIISVMQIVKGMFFPPNTFLYVLDKDPIDDFVADDIVKKASEEGLGIIVLDYDDMMGFNQEKIINLWVRKQSPNVNLAVLIALQIEKNWEGKVRIIHVVKYEQEKDEAYAYIEKMKNLMRIPENVDIEILIGDFKEIIKEAPVSDLNIFGMQEIPDITMIREISNNIKTSVIFLKDSKYESALA